MSKDSLKRAVRTFLIVTVGLFIPGLLGWLNDLTAWARAEGSTPFPDAKGLAYLAVSAIVAGVVTLLNLAVNWIEDVAGQGFLREVPARDAGPQVGQTNVLYILLVAIAAVVLIVLLVNVL